METGNQSALWELGRGGAGAPPGPSRGRLAPTAQPVLYWCARNMSFWSSISFNLAVLMNLLVAFFYPFRGVRGGTLSLISGGLLEAARRL